MAIKIADVFVEVLTRSNLSRDIAREVMKAQAAAPPIRVDVDTKYFSSQFDRVVAAINAKDIKVEAQVKLELDKASAAAVEAQARAAARPVNKHVRLRMDEDISQATARATTGVGMLIAVLGPGLIPVAGAAAAAVLGLGNALTVAGAGAFTAALSFSGIGKALKAMGAVDLKGGREMAALANSQRAASAGVASAKAALARATRSASDSIASALRGEENAARSLQRAQEDLGRAQRDLNDARIEAASDLEDYQRKLRGLAIDERKAVAEVEKARKRLEIARSFGGVPQSIIDRLQLAYDDEVQSLDEVRAAQEDTREEIAKGVEGSDKVIAAKEAERSASEAVLDAQRGLADASAAVASAQASAAESIADAQRGVADALAAGSFAADKQTASMNALDEAMRALTPSQRKFAIFLDSLRPLFDELRESAASSFLPKVEEAIRKLIPLMPKLNRVVKIVGEAMGDMLVAIADWVASGAGSRFLDLIGRIAPKMFETMGRAAIGLGDALLGMLEKTEGLSLGIADGIADMAEAFADWVQSESFDKFLEWATDSLLFVRDRIGGIADGVFALLQAAEPWGRLVLSTLETLGKALSAIPAPVLAVLVTTFLGLVSAVGLLNSLAQGFGAIINSWKILRLISDLTKLSSVLSTVVTSLKAASGIKLGANIAAGAASGAAGSAAAAGAGSAAAGAGAAAGWRAAAGNIGKFLVSAGKVVPVLGTIVGIGVEWKNKNDEINSSSQRLFDSLDASLKPTAETYKAFSEIVGTDFVDSFNDAGISTEELFNAFRAGQPGIDALSAKIYETYGNSELARDLMLDLADAASLGWNLESIGKFNDLLADSGTNATLLRDNLTTATSDLADAHQDLADALKDAYDNFTLLDEAFVSGRTSTLRLEESKAGLAETIDEVGTASKTEAGLYDLTTEKGRTMERAMQDTTAAYNDQFVQQLRNIEATEGHEAAMKFLDDATKVGKDGFSKYTRGLYDTYLQAGLNKETSRLYTDQLLLTPEQIKTQFLTPGITGAQEEIRKLNEKIAAIQWEIEKLDLQSKNPGMTPERAGEIVASRREQDFLNRQQGYAGRGLGGRAFEASVDTGNIHTVAAKAAVKEATKEVDRIARDVRDRASAAAAEAAVTSSSEYDGPTAPGGYVLRPGSYRVTQSYAQHGYAVDLGASTGTPVFAPFKGYVSNRTLRNADGSYRSYGNYVTLSAGAKQFLGAHLSRFGKTGWVDPGDVIGYVGNTGRSYGSHLHAEIRLNGRTVNPAQYIKYDTGGILPHGGGAVNLSRKPEAILTFDQWKTLEKVASNTQQAGRGGPAVHIENYNVSDRVDVDAFMQQVEFFVNSGRV